MTGTTEFRPFFDWALDNPELSLLAAACAFAFLTLAIMTKPHSGRRIVDVLFCCYLLFVVVLLFLDKAAGAGLFGAQAAQSFHGDGAGPSPVAYAYLAFAIIGVLALARSTGLRAAAVAGLSVCLLGPIVATMPTDAGAQAPELVIVLLGAFLLLLQVSLDIRAPLPTHEASAAPQSIA